MSTCVTPACLYGTETLIGTDRTTTTKAASVRKQLGTQNSKSNKGRQRLFFRVTHKVRDDLQLSHFVG